MAVANPRFRAPQSVYVHVPFCRHRCGYCNFTLVAGRDDLMSDYLLALRREMSDHLAPAGVRTLFVGGGTPTHLEPDRLRALLAWLREWCPLAPSHEFCVEANPADLDQTKAELLAEFGVTRVSLAQLFDPVKLSLLERDHLGKDIEQASRLVRSIAADLSLDLIFAVPYESVTTWREDLERAVQLDPDHLSTYGLTLERGTHFWSRWRRGELHQADEETELAMYEVAIEKLTSAGYEHYEVSNFARPGRRCQHNEAYWTGATYFGFGPGAASHLDGVRRVNHRSTTTYLRRVLSGESPVAEHEKLNPEQAARERLVFGLRRLEGVQTPAFAAETGYRPEQLANDRLAWLAMSDLISWTSDRICLTHRGLLLADSVCTALLQD